MVNSDAAAVLGGEYPDAGAKATCSFHSLTNSSRERTTTASARTSRSACSRNFSRSASTGWSPGMRVDLVTALIKTLPKNIRRAVVPAPDYAAAALAAVKPRSEPLMTAMARELSHLGGIQIDAKDFDPAALPDHLRMTFVVEDESGKVLAKGKDLAQLRRTLAPPRVQKEVAKAATGTERAAATVWTSETLGALEQTITRSIGGQQVTGYPALVPENGGVAVRVLSTPAAQAQAMREGTRALLLAAVPTQLKAVTAGLSNTQRLALGQNPDGGLEALVEDCRVQLPTK